MPEHKRYWQDAVVEALEKPAGYNRKEQQDDKTENDDADKEPYPENGRQRSVRTSGHDGKHEQGKRIGDHGAAYGDIDRLVLWLCRDG